MGICIHLVWSDVTVSDGACGVLQCTPLGGPVYCVYLGFMEPCARQGVQKLPIGSSDCPPPRKSLVKGERFLRYEGRPEHKNYTVPPNYTIAVTSH